MACDTVTIFKEYKFMTGTANENVKKSTILLKEKMEAKNSHSINKNISNILGIRYLSISN